MTTFVPKRHSRGHNLHRIADDVTDFGQWLLCAAGLIAIAAGLAFVVAVVGFGYRPEWLLGWWGGA